MKNLSLIAVSAMFLLSSNTLISCKKSDLLDPEENSGRPGRPKKNTSTVTVTPTYTYNKIVTWDNHRDGSYSYSEAISDFDNLSSWNENRADISTGIFRTTLLRNSLAEGGLITRIDVPDATAYRLTYRMMFDRQFEWSKGGKVGFGFLIGDGYTGGESTSGGGGGSARLMWEQSSTGRVYLKPYLYYRDQPGTWGYDFSRTFPAYGSIEKGVWYDVEMYIKSNTGSNTDGEIRMVINGTTLISQAIRWTTDDSRRLINRICFETFRGGNESMYLSSTDGYIYFDNLTWSSL